jgi:ribose 5-phosphate isomerase B
MKSGERIAVGSDDLGRHLKETSRTHLNNQGYDVVDVGVADATDGDHPGIAGNVAESVRHGDVEPAVLICGTGAGMAIPANKVPGVRAVCVADPCAADRARARNDAQVVTSGSLVKTATLATQLPELRLATGFQSGGSARNVEKIAAVERRYLDGASDD